MVFSNFHKIYDVKWEIEYYDFWPAFLTWNSLSKPQNSKKNYLNDYFLDSPKVVTQHGRFVLTLRCAGEKAGLCMWGYPEHCISFSLWLTLAVGCIPHHTQINHFISRKFYHVLVSALSGGLHNTWATERIHSPPVAFGFFGRNWTKLI